MLWYAAVVSPFGVAPLIGLAGGRFFLKTLHVLHFGFSSWMPLAPPSRFGIWWRFPSLSGAARALFCFPLHPEGFCHWKTLVAARCRGLWWYHSLSGSGLTMAGPDSKRMYLSIVAQNMEKIKSDKPYWNKNFVPITAT